MSKSLQSQRSLFQLKVKNVLFNLLRYDRIHDGILSTVFRVSKYRKPADTESDSAGRIATSIKSVVTCILF